jgi:hypothetical protein
MPRLSLLTDERAVGINAEVAWGESSELLILKRWLDLSYYARDARRYVKSNDFDDYDYFLLDDVGLPVVYVEIKRRRTPFEKYKDAMFPLRKHAFAKQLYKHSIPFIGVTEYGDGALVEVDLAQPPAVVKPIARADRPGMKPVDHGLYSLKQLTVLS